MKSVLAQNPGPLTGPGTTTWLIGTQNVVVIDPGPDDTAHLDAIIAASHNKISHIFVTHAHVDHSAGAPRLAQMTGAPVLAWGLNAQTPDKLDGAEGIDWAFRPDTFLRDNEVVETSEWALEVLHTPGHLSDHIALINGADIFTGDLAMAWSSTLISPPHGDLTDYLRSLDRIEARNPSRLIPTHGPIIDNPAARLGELRTHRRARTAQIIAKLADGPTSLSALTKAIYDIDPRLLPAAERNVLAHLLALLQLGAVQLDGTEQTGSWHFSKLS